MTKFLLMSISVLLAIPAWAAGPETGEVKGTASAGGGTSVSAEVSAWQRYSCLELSVELPPNHSSHWVSELFRNGDIWLSIDESHGGAKTHGRMMVAGGRAMLVTGSILTEQCDFDTLNTPFMMAQIAMSLLDYGFPGGPSTVTRRTPFEIAEAKLGIRAATPGVKGSIPAPWQATGTAGRVDDTIEFTISLSFTPEGRGNALTLNFRGVWDGRGRSEKIPDNLSLEGWKVLLTGPFPEAGSGRATSYFCSRDEGADYRTMAELRKALSLED